MKAPAKRIALLSSAVAGYDSVMTLRQRSLARRHRIVAHRTTSFKTADDWDLEFWQKQTPEARLSALVAIRRDIERVKGRNKSAAWES
jgi:hypothetical protein